MQKEQAAKAFWENAEFYPSYPFVKERRKYEIDYLLKNIPFEAESLLDLGCGNGSTTILLRELTYIKKFYCYDIGEAMLSTIGGNRDSELITKVWNANEDNFEFPSTDVTISMNMFPYIFDDEILEKTISNVKSDIFLFRVTCETDRLVINNFSEDLGKSYSACYRTLMEYADIVNKYYTEVEIIRCFPDEIESRYGSKQYFFKCRR